MKMLLVNLEVSLTCVKCPIHQDHIAEGVAVYSTESSFR